MSTSRIAELAATIVANTKQVDTHFANKGLQGPSFDPDGSAGAVLDGEIAASRLALLNATDELHALMQGPADIITRQPFNSWISLQAIVRFGLATSFPEGQDEATFQQIAQISGLPEDQVRRILRHAMTFRIFQEPREGIVRHTAASKTIADDPSMRQWVGLISEELWPAATKAVHAFMKWPGSAEPNQTGFNIAHGTDATIFDDVAKNPERDQRFADAMTYISNDPGLEYHHIVDGYDWASLGEGKIVDVGGSHGGLCMAIAQRFPLLQCVVQDLPSVIELGRQNLPSQLSHRVEFMAHDFFQEQPIKDGAVYCMKRILHDWSDKYAMQILRALIPALKPGAKVLVLEQVLPVPGELSIYQERAFR
ncbi:MAG: hypothetical protein Q9219_007149 [cf. Caloplaca sp. 3 TL-2023]